MAQQSEFLNSVTKFRVTNPKAPNLITEGQFFQWSSNHIYRTSYNDMYTKVGFQIFETITDILQTPVERKSNVIPGYAGYVPQIKANNHHLGATITEQSRQVFNAQTIDTPVNAFSTTGFNSSLIPKADQQLHATSRRYGKSTMVRTATNHQPCDYSTTTFRASYFTPKTLAKPNWRGRTASVQFDNSDVVKIAQVSDKLASGYSSNRQHWDGTSWATEKNQHTDQIRTLYRLGFNQDKPFHKPKLINSDGRLRLRQQVYDTTDK